MTDLIMLGVVTTVGTGAGIWLAAWAWHDAPYKAFAVIIGILDFALGTLAYSIWTEVFSKIILSR